jgi:hypothetical protein
VEVGSYAKRVRGRELEGGRETTRVVYFIFNSIVSTCLSFPYHLKYFYGIHSIHEFSHKVGGSWESVR